MKVICDRQALLAAVNAVASVVPARSPTPALSCLKLAAAKTGSAGELLISGSDGDTSLQLSLTQVDIAQPGSAVVPADKLRQIVAAVEGEPTITLEIEGEVCHIKATRSRFKIFAYPADQFPQLAEMPAATGTGPGAARSIFTHTAGALLTLVNRTVFATARETSRYAINGVLLKRDGKKLEMVATDGRRLAVSRAALKSAAGGESGPTACIIPSKALNLVQRLAGSPDEQVRVAVTDNRAFFAFEEAGEGKKGDPRPRAILSSSLVEGAFPPYEDVIPKDQDKKVSAHRDELAMAIREASILTNEESRGVRMSFSGKSKKLKLTSRAPEMGESEIDVPLEGYEGEDLEISFNPQFITDALKAIDETEVIIELKAPNRPGLLKAGADFLYVVMPVNLPN
jgi:DNA polymerase-3 subunit beta